MKARKLTQEETSRLERIGQDTADIWSASLVRYTINWSMETVTFYCIEHGERFKTISSFRELTEYGLDLMTK